MADPADQQVPEEEVQVFELQQDQEYDHFLITPTDVQQLWAANRTVKSYQSDLETLCNFKSQSTDNTGTESQEQSEGDIKTTVQMYNILAQKLGEEGSILIPEEVKTFKEIPQPEQQTQDEEAKKDQNKDVKKDAKKDAKKDPKKEPEPEIVEEKQPEPVEQEIVVDIDAIKQRYSTSYNQLKVICEYQTNNLCF